MKVERLAFDDADSESYARTRDAGMVLVPRGAIRWDVRLTDRPAGYEHEVALFRDDGDLYGWCDCDGFAFHDGPCAHLWAVRTAADHGSTSIDDLDAVLEQGPTCPMCGQIPPEAEAP